jgi:hypothetical protein
MRRAVSLGAIGALTATVLGTGIAGADDVDGTGNVAGTQDAETQDAAGTQDAVLHNVIYRARVTGLARGALIGYRISDTQVNSTDPTMLPGRNFEATGILTDPKEAGMRISIQWPYSASLHCEILVDDQLVIQADQFIAPRLTPAKDDPDYGAMNCGAPLSNATGVPIDPADMPAMDFSAPAPDPDPAAAPN